MIELLSKSRDAILALRLPAELKAALAKAAERDGRTLSSLVNKILSEWINRRTPRVRR